VEWCELVVASTWVEIDIFSLHISGEAPSCSLESIGATSSIYSIINDLILLGGGGGVDLPWCSGRVFHVDARREFVVPASW
jgi:hypothetical protein